MSKRPVVIFSSPVDLSGLSPEMQAKIKAGQSPNRTETVEQFLARGGKITRVPTPDPEKKNPSIKPASGGGPTVIMSMDEADLYYGENKGKKSSKKKSSAPTIDLSALPPELRKKYVDDVIDGCEESTED